MSECRVGPAHEISLQNAWFVYALSSRLESVFGLELPLFEYNYADWFSVFITRWCSENATEGETPEDIT